MIHTKKLMICGQAFVRTYSDSHYIERGGTIYAEAVDPTDSERIYTESDRELPELSAEAALDIILGGAKHDTI